LQIEEPVWRWYSSAFDFHPTLAGMLGATLVGDEVVQVCQSCKKRLLIPVRMMEAFHHEQLPLDGVMGLIEPGAGHRHLGSFKHRIPAGFLVLKPASHALAIGWPSGGGDVVHKVAKPLPQRKHAQA